MAAGQNVEIPFSCDSDALWYVDGVYVGRISDGGTLNFPLGEHKVRAVSADDTMESSAVVFTVKH